MAIDTSYQKIEQSVAAAQQALQGQTKMSEMDPHKLALCLTWNSIQNVTIRAIDISRKQKEEQIARLNNPQTFVERVAAAFNTIVGTHDDVHNPVPDKKAYKQAQQEFVRSFEEKLPQVLQSVISEQKFQKRVESDLAYAGALKTQGGYEAGLGEITPEAVAAAVAAPVGIDLTVQSDVGVGTLSNVRKRQNFFPKPRS